MRYASTVTIAALALAGGALMGSQIDDPIRNWWLGQHGRGWHEHRAEVLAEFAACPEYAFYGDSQVEYGPWALVFGGRVRNLGISGETVAGVATRIDPDCAGPILLLVGVNDLRNGLPPEDIAGAVSDLIASTQRHVFLVETLPVRDHFAKLTTGLRDLNARMLADCNDDCTWVTTWDVLTSDGALAESYSWDGLHLNAKGYRALAERLADALSLPALAQPAVADQP